MPAFLNKCMKYLAWNCFFSLNKCQQGSEYVGCLNFLSTVLSLSYRSQLRQFLSKYILSKKMIIWKITFLENDLSGKVELVCESLIPCFVRTWSKMLVRKSDFEFHSLSIVCITKLIIIYSSNSNADNYSITRRLLNAKAPLFSRTKAWMHKTTFGRLFHSPWTE